MVVINIFSCGLAEVVKINYWLDEVYSFGQRREGYD